MRAQNLQLTNSSLIFLLLVGCAGPDSFGGSRQAIIEWGNIRGFHPQDVIADTFQLLQLIRISKKSEDTFNLYIEGDGAPWLNQWYPPVNPTPLKPLAMAIAATDPSAAVIYLGRPCQYLDNLIPTRCPPAYWQERRFSLEVINAYQLILNKLKRENSARYFRLLGYSGGGVIATLLAAQRNDIKLLVTIATPLDLSAWIAWHKLSPLAGSIDPMQLDNIKLPPSFHFAGSRDQVVPPHIIQRFIDKYGGKLIIISGFNHGCCWSKIWTELLKSISIGE